MGWVLRKERSDLEGQSLNNLGKLTGQFVVESELLVVMTIKNRQMPHGNW